MIVEPIKQRIRALLLSVQAVTRTDMLYAAKGGFWLSLGSVSNSLITFGLALAFANLIPKETYGTYKYILSAGGLLTAFTLTGVGDAIFRSVARSRDGALRQSFVMSIKWSLALVVGGLGAAAWYFLNGNRTLGISMIAVALVTPIINSGLNYASFLQGKRAFATSVRYAFLRNLAAASALVTAMLITQDTFALVLTYLLAHAVGVMLAYAASRRYATNQDEDPELPGYARHLSLVNVIGSLSASLDKVLIFQNLGAVETAIYAFSLAVPDQVEGIVGNIHSLALPKFAAKPKDEVKQGLLRKTLMVFVALLVAYGAYVLLVPWVYRLLLPSYVEAIPFAIALGAVFVVTGTSRLPLAFLTAQKAVRERYLIGLISPIVRIALMGALVVPYGIWGVVWARVSTKALNTLFIVYLARRL